MGDLFVIDAVIGWNGWAVVIQWIAWPAIVSAGASWLTTKATINHQRERLRREFQLEFATEAAIKALLIDGQYEMRSFDKIKRHLPGFDDNELRRYLIRSGAVSFAKTDGTELWGLLERHKGEAFK